jgi:hypothetical protein
MGLAARIDQLVPDLFATLRRFPVPAALSVVLCVYVNYRGPGSSEDWIVILGAAAAFLASGAGHLYAEGARRSPATGIAIALAAAIAAGLAGYLAPVLHTSSLFLFCGLIPVVMIAPYLHRDARQASLWLFNLRLWLAALLAALVALAFAAGLSAIVEALNFLFGTGLHSYFHEHIWTTAMTLVAPLYGLALMPRQLDEEVDIASQRGTLLERGVSVLVNYVAVPVILVYAVILHAYAVKILAQQALPNGQVATMVSIFAVGGTGVWLIAWPWRETGTRLLRWFMAGWFWLTLVPAALLIAGIWRRLSDYGVTPDRYGIAIIATWLAAITAYFGYRRNRADMRAILGALAVLLLIGSTGPMGAYGLTIKSQVPRLEAFLSAHGLIANGKAIKSTSRLTSEITSEGYTMLNVIQAAGGLEELKPWFAGAKDDPFATGSQDYALSSSISAWLGFDNPYNAENAVSFTAQLPLDVTLPPGGHLIGPLQSQYTTDPNFKQQPLTAINNGTTLTILLPDGSQLTMPTDKLLNAVRAATKADTSLKALRLPIAPTADLLIDNVYGTVGDKGQLSSMRFWLLVRSGV